jgi:hypothetical protein
MKEKITIYYELPFLEEYLKRQGNGVKEKDLQTTIKAFVESAMLYHLRMGKSELSKVMHYMLTQKPVCKGSREAVRALPQKAFYLDFDHIEEDLHDYCRYLRRKQKDLLLLARKSGIKILQSRSRLLNPEAIAKRRHAELRHRMEDTYQNPNQIPIIKEDREPHKIIFLDFDGVLNSEKHFNCLKEQGLPTEDFCGTIFDPEATEALQKIIDATGAVIVISSSWRFAGLGRMKYLWDKRGIAGKVVDITSLHTVDDLIEEHIGDDDFDDFIYKSGSPRAYEINDWLTNHPETMNYVILDDERMSETLETHFVNVNPHTGLTMADAEKAIEILNS